MNDFRNSPAPNPFQLDLIKNRYHFFNLANAKIKNYYPKQLLALMPNSESFNRNFPVIVGENYSIRAFFAISEPFENEVEYQSGYLDLKLIMRERDDYVGEVVTSLPPGFALKKGENVNFCQDNMFYKPDYNSGKKKA